MDTSKLKKFAQYARRSLIEQVESKLNLVIADESEARRETPKAIDELESKLKDLGREQLIEQVAYTWFNRFCALCYMDVNQYNRIMVVSPLPGQFQPEILAEAKAGHIDEKTVSEPMREKIFGLLGGSITSRDGQSEAFRLLIVAVCNELHSVMPYMFERIDNYTELLMPEDLLSDNSILADTREAMTSEACESVETIGWLYQFYISEKKDDVFAALKKGKKITPENIPAATQLFTPHWIVRYLVQNSLGRLWMLNHPDSLLFQNMKDRGEDCYYIEPEEPETDFLQISSPEEIKICDPACGSGHMLTYSFDLLYAIYEEQGYQPSDIPQLILTHNLYGVEIDQRAGALAAFALTMKAREKYRRFLTPGKVVQPNICVLENIQIDPEDLSAYMDMVGRDLFSGGLEEVVNQWEEADNFGSLIRPLVTDVSEVLDLLCERQMDEDLLLADVHHEVLKALRQADYLSPKYHVVVANPPYATNKTLNPVLQEQLENNMPEGESDLFAAFIVRCNALCRPSAMFAMITMQGWMNQSTFPELRHNLIEKASLISLIHLGPGAFEEISGDVVTVCAFVFANVSRVQKAVFFRLTEAGRGDCKEVAYLEAVRHRGGSQEFSIDPHEFEKLPDMIFGYWASPAMVRCFETYKPISEVVALKAGISTGDNTLFQREWYECSLSRTSIPRLNSDYREAIDGVRWYPCASGGPSRKWFGNHSTLIDWESDGTHIRNFTNDRGKMRGAIRNPETFFKFGLTWSKISSGTFAARIRPRGFLSDDTGRVGITKCSNANAILAFLCSSVANRFLQLVAPTLSFTSGDVGKLPWFEPELQNQLDQLDQLVKEAVEISMEDWNESETSWDFSGSAIITSARDCLESATTERMVQVTGRLSRLLQLEEQNNNFFAVQYGLENSFDFSVKEDDISLRSIDLTATIREFISYAVGCMLGRYSLDKLGLILANQGETADDYRKLVPDPTFAPDEVNVIPLLDGDWFTDDISERFKEFLKITFGTENFDANLTFLENAIYPDNLSGGRRKTIRDYFLKEFYNHHVKLYKKRPIYWLFSSPKGSFNALIYMHRYRPDTVSVVLNDYLREFHAKLEARKESLEQVEISASASATDKKNAINQIRKIDQMLVEIKDYEHDILYPLAAKKIEINLDDGVKHNYPLFGKALKKIAGLS